MFPNRKTKTQTGKLKFQTRNQKPHRKICPGKDSPIVTNNRKPKREIRNPTDTQKKQNPTGRPAPERRLRQDSRHLTDNRHLTERRVTDPNRTTEI